jgi:tetratricopeptide (TPR) repeat protein
MQTFRLFVSSPGDVMVERRRVENVVSRLNGEFAGVTRLEAVRWETEFYQAHSTFQTQIPRSTDCDLVIGIVKWRLGTELPPDFDEKLPDGQPFPSGTAYELLTAIAQRQKGGKLPDIYVFRFTGSSPSVAVDDPNRVKVERDWQTLKGFFQEWFLTDRGHFKAAFNQYSSEDDFEAQLEKLLRNWVADKVAGGRVVRWPIEVKGSPFRGLAAFGTKHAPVFFGRGHDTSRAVDLWREAGRRGSPYLLVVGASGSGKSSLVRAGLVPRLTTPGVIKEVDIWRVVVMRPGDNPAGPFAALAAALTQDEAALPKEEEGRGPALPEIAQGDSQTPAELAAVLRHADASATKPIRNALTRAAASEHDRDRYSREVRCDLVVLIDQFEELFAASVSEAERAAFIDFIAALVGTGRVWVAATLRADFYARMLEQPALKKLKELGATYDLAPPGPVELAEIVRAPAEAAGLVFETDATTGERLDARLLRDADRPDMLPLVQLALSRLFEGRERVGEETRLPLKVYESLGGLKGIVDEAGETALASLGEAEKARLPRLLRQLAVPAQDQDGTGKGALTIRAVVLPQAAPDDIGRRLLDALVMARLLTTSGVEADAQVRLAHQRVLEDWKRARSIVAESADFYRIRADLEESRRKWEAGKRRSELLLPRGLPLAEAESIVGKYGDELTSEMLSYVRASRQRANRAQMIGWSAAAAFFLLAVGASITAKIALDQRAAAESARKQVQVDLMNMSKQEMARVDPSNASSMRQDLMNIYYKRGNGNYGVGDLDRALADYTEAIQLEPEDVDDTINNSSNSYHYLARGRTYRDKGELDHAIADFDQAIKLKPDSYAAFVERGIAYREKGEIDHAIADFDQAMVVDPHNAWGFEDDAVYNRGIAYRDNGDRDKAIADYDQAIADASQLIQAQPKLDRAYVIRGNAYRAKGDFDHAIADFDQAIMIQPRDSEALYNRGLAYRDKGDLDHAIADFNDSLSIRKDVNTLDSRGFTYLKLNRLDEAIADFNAALALNPKLASSLYGRGLAELKNGDRGGADADIDAAKLIKPDIVEYVARNGLG